MKVNNQSAFLESTVKVNRKIVNVDGTTIISEDMIVHEHSMDIVVNEQLVAKIVCTPSNLVELVIGRLVTEGIIAGTKDVESIYICESAHVAKVFLNQEIQLEPFFETEPTCCTSNKVFMRNSNALSLKTLNKSDWKQEWIFNLANAFAGGSKIHKTTKGTHGCYLSVKGEIVFASEDIGRHNAMDKAIGYALMQGYEPSDCILFTTGRVPTDMVKKAVAARIPVLVSKAVPTDEALLMAEEYNLTLICKAWPDQYEIFCEAK